MRVLLAACFTAGAFAATAWWYLMPKGFPVTHPRFWVNSVFPPVACAVCLLGIVTAVRKQDAMLKCLVLASGTVLIVAGITGKYLFPISLAGVLLAAVLIYLVLTVVLVGRTLWVLRGVSVPAWLVAICILGGAVVGAFLPWSQRAMDAATKPYSRDELPPLSDPLKSDGQSLSLSDRITVFPDTGIVRLDSGEITLEAFGLLTFHSRSPDRFWTVFAPRSIVGGPWRSLTGLSRDARSVTLDYKDDGRSRLRISTADTEKIVRIEALSHLPRAVYSHLNSFCRLSISGSGSLALSFSPCGDIVEIKPSDYPVGRPARLAYLDAENVFHVVEAHSGEKGPFRKLAEGILKANEPLRITVYNNKKAVCRITVHDWARQASRQLSPAAGWGLPENAIQFSLHSGGGSSVGVIFMTLASTSVGRGWDSVGHAAGTYRNTMTIEPVPENPTTRSGGRRQTAPVSVNVGDQVNQ